MRSIFFKIKVNSKKEKGITLIALVMTIIILIILSTVAISFVFGDSGLIKYAEKAKDLSEADSTEEEKELTNMTDYLNKLLGGENEEENPPEETPGLELIKVGDYVDYSPDDKADDVYYDKFGETYSGYANTNIGQDDTLKWMVFNINSDGTVSLISDKPTSESVVLKGARGYNNGVFLLNDYCKTMYSNSSIGAEARSLNIEDIQEVIATDETTGKKLYETANGYNEFQSLNYGVTVDRYPLQWKKDDDINDGSIQNSVTPYNSESDAIRKPGDRNANPNNSMVT